jgi:hypothetical protein
MSETAPTDAEGWDGFPPELEELKQASLRFGWELAHENVWEQIDALSDDDREYLIYVAGLWILHKEAYSQWRKAHPPVSFESTATRCMCLSALLEYGGFYREASHRMGLADD